MAVAAPRTLNLTEIRDAAMAALAPVADTDPNVLDPVDSLTPPALIVDWGDPWLVPGVGSGTPTMGPCVWTAVLVVVCVAGRFEPGPGMDICEQLVAYTIDRLKADPYVWAISDVSAPRQRDMAAIPYLACDVTYQVRTSV